MLWVGVGAGIAVLRWWVACVPVVFKLVSVGMGLLCAPAPPPPHLTQHLTIVTVIMMHVVLVVMWLSIVGAPLQVYQAGAVSPEGVYKFGNLPSPPPPPHPPKARLAWEVSAPAVSPTPYLL
jgi:hypothetical protein